MRMAEGGYDSREVGHVFFTHHHLDHNLDFFALMKANYLMGRKDMKVYGPAGTKDWVDAQLHAYPYLEGRFKLEIRELAGGEVRLGRDHIKVKPARHIEPSLAYRIDSTNASLVYSGDTEPCEGVRELIGDGVDMLIHECSLFEDVKGHTTPRQLADFLVGLPVERLVLTHFSPQVEGRESEAVEIVSKSFEGEIIVGEDLLVLEV